MFAFPSLCSFYINNIAAELFKAREGACDTQRYKTSKLMVSNVQDYGLQRTDLSFPILLTASFL